MSSGATAIICIMTATAKSPFTVSWIGSDAKRKTGWRRCRVLVEKRESEFDRDDSKGCRSNRQERKMGEAATATNAKFQISYRLPAAATEALFKRGSPALFAAVDGCEREE